MVIWPCDPTPVERVRECVCRRPGVGALFRWTIAMHGIPAFMVLIVLALSSGCSERTYRQIGSSMSPTVSSNEVVMVDYSAYATTTPQRWDAVVIRQPDHHLAMGGRASIRRVVGLPGESIKIEHDAVHIGDDRLTPPAGLAAVHYLPGADEDLARTHCSYPYEIPPDAYFVLGDNTTKAWDSRYYGAVALTNILAKVKDK